jgi:hypothetical protein
MIFVGEVMASSTIGVWLTFATLVIGYIFTDRRESSRRKWERDEKERQRKWDQEDRREVASKVQDVAFQAKSVASEAAKASVILTDLAEIGVKSHALLNSQMGILLREKAELADELAKVTGKESHIETARQARAAYNDHVHAQDVVDARLAAEQSVRREQQ